MKTRFYNARILSMNGNIDITEGELHVAERKKIPAEVPCVAQKADGTVAHEPVVFVVIRLSVGHVSPPSAAIKYLYKYNYTLRDGFVKKICENARTDRSAIDFEAKIMYNICR